MTQVSGKRGLRGVAEAVCTTAVIIACGALVWSNLPAKPKARSNTPPPLPTYGLSVSDGAVTGTATARVGVLEFSEFQCPFCGLFARDTLPELSERYVKAGKVLVGFRHFPLREIHPLADQAARAAECGRKGGKFWEMHDALFSDPARLNIEQLIALGTSLQLGPTFEACLAAKSDQVERDTALGLKLGVTSTPTFFLGRIGEDGLLHVSDRIVGAQRAAQFAVIIDKLLRG